jgi:hypothetical protein
MSSNSPKLMRDLRVLHRLLHKLGITLKPERLPSATNIFAGRASRTWDPGYLQARAQVRRAMLASYAHVKLRDDGASAYHPLGVHPVAMRKVTMAALGEDWGPSRARLYCPHMDLIRATVRKMRRERARGVLLVPDWEGAPWMAQVLALGSKFWVWAVREGWDVWTGRRSVEPNWRLRMVEVGL